MKANGNRTWFVVVSFRTELLSEYACQDGLKLVPKLLGKEFCFLKSRKNIDNDICCVKEEYALFEDRIKKDYKKALPRFFKKIDSVNKAFIAFAKKLPNKKELEKITKKRLEQIFTKYYDLYEHSTALIGIPAISEFALMDVLTKKLQSQITKLKDERQLHDFLSAISFSKKESATYNEKADLLKLAAKINKSKSKDLGHLETKYAKEISAHQKKYGWIMQTLFLGDDYDIKKIASNLKQLAGDEPEKKLQELLRNREEEKEHFRKAMAIPDVSKELKQDISLLQDLIYVRNSRLEQMNQGCYLGKELLEEVARRIGLTYDEAIYLFPDEIKKALKGSLPVSASEIDVRIKKYALITENGKTNLYTGDEVDNLKAEELSEGEEKVSELKGFGASKGIATGPARIVKDRTELHKVMKGDILITRLTTPDFVVAMEKAAAIVTDIGGVTSHAAIVSRELGKPCVTGTGRATKAFKDGDLVEVDANSGIVRILKKAGE